MDSQGYVSAEEVRSALRTVYQADPEANPQKALLRSLADDLQPVGANGRWKPHPLLVPLSLLVCALTGVFLYFTPGAYR